MLLDLDVNQNWCLSGGADGADLEWGMVARSIGHGVVHYSFRRHKTSAPEAELVMLSEQQLLAADHACRQANITLHRRFPAKSEYTTNMLRRNWYQIRVAASCYAISTFEQPLGATIPLGTLLPPTAQVKGGTAWAVEMFIDRHQRQRCPCYVFDQVLCHWFRWAGDGWQCIYEAPKPSGIYAGIGRRDLLPMGKLAIRVLMGYNKVADTAASRAQAEQIARRKFEERARLLEGHKMGAWESLSDAMKEALIHHEMTRKD